MEQGSTPQQPQPQPQPQKPREAIILSQIQDISGHMTGWLKFLGILLIIAGGLYALTLVGIILAWVPIWLGILLLQAGNKASLSSMTRNPSELVIMMEKLRLFFMIYGILAIVSIALVVLGIIFFSTFIGTFMENMPQFQEFN